MFRRFKQITMSILTLSSLLFVIQVDGKNLARARTTEIDPNSLTADDQLKGSRHDVELTRRVREEITKRDHLSTQAHNIQIITLNGVMTLRGQVKSMGEKNQIAHIAKSVTSEIHNELEVIK